MVNVSLRQLELFAALPNYDTLSEAAAHLHVSESALSQSITALERSVGQQLCVRRKARGLTLTPTGQEFARRARRIIDETQELILDAQRGQELRGPVKFGCFSSFATNVAPGLLDGFPTRHPEVDVEVMVGTTEELLSALEAGRLDVALVYNVSLPAEYHRRMIYSTELEVHLHPDHQLAKSEAVDLAELADEPLVQYDATPGTVNVLDAFSARGLEPTIEAKITQIGLVTALVSRNMGYSLLMSRPNQQLTSTQGRSVVTRPLDPPVTVTHVVGIWPHDMSLTPRASALLDFAIELFGTQH